MADPRIPRPAGQPPPLPPRPLVPEPFLDLTEDAPPDTLRIRRDEERPPPLPLTEETARALRRDIVLLREALPTQPALPLPELDGENIQAQPQSVRTRSQHALAMALGTSAAAGVTAILTLLGGIAAKQWPAYAELITSITRALGGGP